MWANDLPVARAPADRTDEPTVRWVVGRRSRFRSPIGLSSADIWGDGPTTGRMVTPDRAAAAAGHEPD